MPSTRSQSKNSPPSGDSTSTTPTLPNPLASNVGSNGQNPQVAGPFSVISRLGNTSNQEASSNSVQETLQSLSSAQEAYRAQLAEQGNQLADYGNQMSEIRQMLERMFTATLPSSQAGQESLAGPNVDQLRRDVSPTSNLSQVASEEYNSARSTPSLQQNFYQEVTSGSRRFGADRRLSSSPPQNQYWPPPTQANHFGEIFHNPLPIHQIEPPRFNGDKSQARAWLRKYEDVMNINGYDDLQKFKRARAYLDGEAQHWYNAMMRLDPDADWYTLKNSLLKHFCGIDGAALLRRKLAETRQKPGEHPSSYLFRIIDACLEYNPNMRDEELLQRTCAGLNDTSFNFLSALKDKEKWTMPWIRSRFEQYKLTTERPSRELPPADSNTPRRRNAPTSAVPRVRDLSTWICFNCNQAGHQIENCPTPRNDERIKQLTEAHRAAKLTRKTQAQQDESSPTHRVVKALNSSTRPPPPPSIVLAEPALPCDQITKPTLAVNINGKELTGRIDTGADLTVLPGNVANELGLQLMPWTKPALKGAGNKPVKVTGMSSVICTHAMKTVPLIVVIMPGQDQILWGMDLLKAFSIKLDFSEPYSSEIPESGAYIGNRPINSVESHVATAPHPIDKIQFGELDNVVKSSLDEALLEFQDVFSQDESDIGRTSTLKHRILLTDDKPVQKGPYKVPFRYLKDMEDTLFRLKATGAIRHSTSKYSSPVFFVEKDRGKGKRLVADYRALNDLTIPDQTPMPHPEHVFGLLAGSKIFAKVDITSMFNQIEVDERDVDKTAITTPHGLFECPLMPFGLKNAPATAVRLMREVLRGLDNKTCSVYFDDIIIFAPNSIELVQRCKDVFSRVRQHGLKLKPSKCIFGVESVNFLGHVISSKGIQIDPKRTQDVVNFPVPRNPSHVRSLHGLGSYNRKHIPGFADLCKPLTPLMGKPSDFHWTVEAQEAFEKLKQALISPPLLVHYNPDADHELRTDASSHAIGAVFYQKCAEDPDQTGVVLYHSRTLKPAERNYSATERELLAAYDSVMELKHFLIGKRFTLVTDHAALSLLRNGKDPHGRLARWTAILGDFDFEVKYKKGSLHLDADCMSRLITDTSREDDCGADLDNHVNVDDQACNEIVRSICHVTTQPTEEPALPEDPLINMRAEQRQDEFCNNYIQILESSTMTERDKLRRAKFYTMQDDLLYRIRAEDNFVLCIPTQRRAAILISCHDLPLAGHLGFSRTYGLIRSRFYWPKMRRDIKSYVASCAPCQRRKIANTRKEGLTRPLPIAENIFDCVGIDLLTKLPVSYNGYNTILVCTDNLSKYVITAPLKNEEAETIIHAFFNHVVAKHGCPKVVLSDCGANISGERSRDFFRLFGILRKHTSAYHPQTNGQTERFNRTFATSLTMFTSRNQTNWSDYLQALTFAYNITDHSVTRVPPFELVFGHKPRIPIDNILSRSEFVDPTRPAPGALSTTTVNMMKKYILDNQNANKRRLDKRLNPSTFKEGDLVLVERPTRVPNTATKLQYTYIGPYKIRRKISDLQYEIAFPRGRPGGCNVHPCHLRHFVQRNNVITDPMVDPTFIPHEYTEQVNANAEPNSETGDAVSESGESLRTLPAEEDAEHSLVEDAEDDIPSPLFESLLSPPHVGANVTI